MKIISAQIAVRLDDDDDFDALAVLDEMLTAIGFAGPTNATSIPSTDHPDDAIYHLSFEPADE